MPVVDLIIPELHPAQNEIRLNPNRFNVVDCGRRFGKTMLGTDIITDTILEKRPVGWFAPNDKILDEVWDEIKALLEPIISYKNETKKRLKFYTGAKLEMWSMEAGIVARSRKYGRVVVDEAAAIPNLKKRWDEEIRPTLTDYEGDAWFLSTPKGYNDFKDMFDLGWEHIDPEWSSWKMPTWMNPHLPPKELAEIKRKCEAGDRPALQEYGAEFVASEDIFVPPEWIDACAAYGGMPAMRTNQPIIVGVDAASVSDTFALVGVYRDHADGHTFKVAFVKVFEPSELRSAGGIVSFAAPRDYARFIANNYHVVAFVYDPYQLVDFAGQAMTDGLGLFQEMNQGQDRLFADRHLYEIIRDRRFAYGAHEHQVLAQHIKNANQKLVDDKLRMIKRKDELKIDAGVACSMACYAAAEWYNI